MTQWATQAEERVSAELKGRDPTVRSRKKKTLTWWCLFGLLARERTDLAQFKPRATCAPCPNAWE